ncbi:MAG: prolipoprotein diacylglyceryl transferase, partial [bacterium]|nr:prolipoprotein diacylglyceryl transferase [bacterium]
QYQNYSFFHPVWLYESILDFVLFLILIKSKNNQTAKYLIGYGLIRFFTEFLRWDTWNFYGFKMAQVISLIFFIVGLLIIIKANNHLYDNKTRVRKG